MEKQITVRDYILDGMINSAKSRLDKLMELGAPGIMIDGQRKALEKLQSGELPVHGDMEALNEVFLTRERKTGRGGKFYLVINNNINFSRTPSTDPISSMPELKSK